MHIKIHQINSLVIKSMLIWRIHPSFKEWIYPSTESCMRWSHSHTSLQNKKEKIKKNTTNKNIHFYNNTLLIIYQLDYSYYYSLTLIGGAVKCMVLQQNFEEFLTSVYESESSAGNNSPEPGTSSAEISVNI